VRVEELINYFDYGYRAPDRAEVFRPWVAVAPSPFNSGKQLLHIGLRGYDVRNRPPLNLVFLVDVSGSMAPEDRLPLARQALNTLVDGLRPQDRVSIAVYAGSAGEVLAPTRGHDKLRMRCALQALEAGRLHRRRPGPGPGLRHGPAQFRPQRGEPRGPADGRRLQCRGDRRPEAGGLRRGQAQDGDLSQRLRLRRRQLQRPADAGAGQNGNGHAGYVDSVAESRKLFADDFAGSLFPIADDVKVQVEFNPARVSEYRLIGYETRLLNREDFNNDAVDAGEVGSGVAVTALYELTPAGGASSVDPLRYGGRPPPPRRGGGEIAFLKVRYKAPGASASVLRDRPITDRDAHASLAAAPEQLRWAAAVAGYGQLLRGDPNLAADFNWDRVRSIAVRSTGEDPLRPAPRVPDPGGLPPAARPRSTRRGRGRAGDGEVPPRGEGPSFSLRLARAG
jgi:Ca-activated chloride channel family protein